MTTSTEQRAAVSRGPASRPASVRTGMAVVIAVAALTWIPRFTGPIDLRWDGSVHYILGTSLAQGHGYRLLSEPGAIRDIQYPPLLPAIVAVHQRILGTTQTTVVGEWLRRTSFVVFIVYAVVAFRFLASYVAVWPAVAGTLLSLVYLNSWFLSDALYPEVWFAVATTGFLLALRSTNRHAHGVVAYLCAVAAYAFRTVGIVALPVWVLHSVIGRRWREAAMRVVLAAAPVALWQGYTFQVEHSTEYSQPAYAYQRAPYMFYNVSYATNVTLRDPLTPEKGLVQPLRRFVRNLLVLPSSLGEAFVAPHGYIEAAAHAVLGDRDVAWGAVAATLAGILWVVGAVLAGGGIIALLFRGEWLVPAYLAAYVAALCVTPFPDQYSRYLMPVMPQLALAAVVVLGQPRQAAFGQTLRAADMRPRWRYLIIAVVLQGSVLISAFVRERQVVSYVDEAGRPVSYRLFFYPDAAREFDEVVDRLRAVAHPDEVVAAGTPHWIYLRTGLHTVMPPFEHDAVAERRLLDSVPVRFLVIGNDVVGSERYTRPVVEHFQSDWTLAFASSGGSWQVYERRLAH